MSASAQEFPRLDVGCFGLPAHGRSDGARLAADSVVLEWIARFAFTTAPLLAARWSVSPQRMGARLRRLERDGLVRRTRRQANRPALVCVTSLGALHLGGLRAPRPPRLADELCTDVREQSYEADSSWFHATVSIGGVFLGPGTPTHHDALLAADTALYEAKAAGGDRAILHEASQAA